MVPNTDQRSGDYSEMSAAYRPSHADATYDMKCVLKLSKFFCFFSGSPPPQRLQEAKEHERERNKRRKNVFCQRVGKS